MHEVESVYAASSGFDAKVAIHPRQLSVIRASYRPAPDQVAWARRLFEEVGHNRDVTTFEGRMVDSPFYLAERILLRMAEAEREVDLLNRVE